jgi:hypothetical protein
LSYLVPFCINYTALLAATIIAASIRMRAIDAWLPDVLRIILTAIALAIPRKSTFAGSAALLAFKGRLLAY